MKKEYTFYQEKYIKTKNKLRKIITYKDEFPEIKKQHKEIIDFIEDNFIPSKFTKAYIKNKSIFHNAKIHMYNDIFVSLDVKDFFNNINHKLLTNALYYELNKLNNNTINKIECSNIVSNCSISKKGLPLGLITSPILSNVYMKEFDNILYGKLKQFNLKDVMYTRYADDLVISFKNEHNKEATSMKDIVDKIIFEVKIILSRYKLKLNSSKTQIINFEKSNHVKITGVNIIQNVAKKRSITVGRKMKNDLFHKAIKAFEEKSNNKYEIMKIKGLESFILSIEKKGYEENYSKNMKQKINDLGFESLHILIKNLYFEQ